MIKQYLQVNFRFNHFNIIDVMYIGIYTDKVRYKRK